MSVKAKKHLGQHFLTDKNICQKIANQYQKSRGCKKVLEIGPGMGALTEFLLKKDLDVWAMDIDTESIDYLKEHFPNLDGKILAAYDKNGEIIRTIERFQNVKLPKDVRNAVYKRFPNWSLEKDVYLVNYHKNNEKVSKQYKVKLKNGKKVMRVKLAEDGNFL